MHICSIPCTCISAAPFESQKQAKLSDDRACKRAHRPNAAKHHRKRNGEPTYPCTTLGSANKWKRSQCKERVLENGMGMASSRKRCGHVTSTNDTARRRKFVTTATDTANTVAYSLRAGRRGDDTSPSIGYITLNASRVREATGAGFLPSQTRRRAINRPMGTCMHSGTWHV